MNCAKSGTLNCGKVVLHDAIGLERVILADGGTLKPAILFELDVLCKTKPHCDAHTSSAKIASRDHSRAN